MRRRSKIAGRIFPVIWFLGLVWGTSYYLYSHKGHIDFEHISVEHGLSQSTVQYILQDSKGFLWVCTEDGLNRYDGYDFRTYRHETGNPHSLCQNQVLTLRGDKDEICLSPNLALRIILPISFLTMQRKQFACFENKPTDYTD